ncbi:hypothetical protein [Mitsuaria sp. 7]|uniref:hypothetical protein n=1 Tax=Mitsuaria sp. 7 TaxID=1658665 RepID=UPI0007DCDCC0|nr:hypothetical protein [Mitsuaria sp. 7]ANH66794.1 hypothetical protein ABE85_03025 [Mitsuaria sp. 7]
MMNETEYQRVDARFRRVFDRYAAQLSEESQTNICHFLEVAEIEMACESFVLSLLEEEIQLSVDVKRELLDLALGLQLDRESVFRSDFWQLASTAFASASTSTRRLPLS